MFTLSDRELPVRLFLDSVLTPISEKRWEERQKGLVGANV